jgi:hypothetical protein
MDRGGGGVSIEIAGNAHEVVEQMADEFAKKGGKVIRMNQPEKAAAPADPGTEDLLAAMEGWADRNAIMRRMDAAELAGQVVKLPRGDARRTVAPNGNRARAVQWLPMGGRHND